MKKIAIIGLVLLLAGAAVFTAGYFLAGRDVTVLNGSVGNVNVEVRGGQFGDYGVVLSPVGEGFSGERGESRSENGVRQFDFGGVTRLVLAEDAGNVTLAPSADGKLHVYAWEEGNDTLAASEKDGTLTLRRTGSVTATVGVFFSTASRDTRVELPEGLSVEISTDAGNLSVEGCASGTPSSRRTPGTSS